MFGVNKEELVKGLVKVSCRLCGYLGHMCDCKYMGDNDDFAYNSEQTGCPETAMAATLINAMTPDEFKRIAKRARIQISEYEQGPLDLVAEMRDMKNKRDEHYKQSVNKGKK